MRGTGRQGTGRVVRSCPTCGGSGQRQSQAGQEQFGDEDPTRSTDPEAERERAEAERQRREQEDAARKQREFEATKRDALAGMKGISETTALDLKGLDSVGKLGLKDAGSADSVGIKTLFEKGSLNSAPVDLRVREMARLDVPLELKTMESRAPQTMVDSSVVDLRDLVDPNRPIKIDLNVVKGRERRIPVQTDPTILENANYNAGFEALKRFDPEAAVALFEAALRERPNHLSVRNALLLAQDLAQVRHRKQAEAHTRATQLFEQGCIALEAGKASTAQDLFTRARELDPDDCLITWFLAIADHDAAVEGTERDPVTKQLMETLDTVFEDRMREALVMPDSTDPQTPTVKPESTEP